MERVSRLAIVACFALLVLGGCSKPGPVDDAPFLAQLNMSAPIGVSVSLAQQVDAQGNLGNTDDTAVIAALLHINVLLAAPNTAGPPYWRFMAFIGTISDNRLSVVVAKRVITGREDQRRWTENGVDFYSEIISYRLKLDGPFAALMTVPPLRGAIRLALRKDAQSGTWTIAYGDRGTQLSIDQDEPAVRRALLNVGIGFRDGMDAEIQAARTKAFDLIEQDIANRGVMQRVAGEENLRYSRNGNLSYFPLGTYPLGSLNIASLRNACAQTHVAGLAWRLPHLNELQAMFGQSNFFAQASVVDTPDHRLWPDFAHVIPPGWIVMSDTPDANSPLRPLALQVETNGSQFVAQFHLTAIGLGGNDFEAAPITDGWGGQFHVYAICVATGSKRG